MLFHLRPLAKHFLEFLRNKMKTKEKKLLIGLCSCYSAVKYQNYIFSCTTFKIL